MRRRHIVLAGKLDGGDINWKFISRTFLERRDAEHCLNTVRDYPFHEIQTNVISEEYLMSNIERIELLIEDLNSIPNVTSGVMASIAWSFAMSLGGNLAAQQRVFDPHDPEFGRLFSAQKQERMDQLLSREAELTEIVGWVTRYTSRDFAPTAADVVERLSSTHVVQETDAQLLASYMEAFGVSRDEALRQFAQDHEERKLRAEVQARAAEANRDELLTKLQRALDDDQSPERLNDFDAERIFERIAEKLERYIERREQRARQTRRSRRIAALAAECKLLEAIMERADEFAERLETEREAVGLRAEPVEERRSESAPSEHGDQAEAV